MRRLAAVVSLAVAVACARAPNAPRPEASAVPPADDGVTLAANAGPILVVLSFDPALVGDDVATVALRDAHGSVAAAVATLAVTLDGAPLEPAPQASGAAGSRWRVSVPRAGHAVVTVDVVGPEAAGAARFDLDLPATRPPDGALARVDAAMNALRTLRETQTLDTGTVSYTFHYEYEAPDRVRYTWTRPEGALHETRILGPTRYDRDGTAAWTTSDLGSSTPVPHVAFAAGASRVRVVGHDGALRVLAFVQRGRVEVAYRLWIGDDDRVLRYAMMATGHYMTGSYADFDAPVDVAAP